MQYQQNDEKTMNDVLKRALAWWIGEIKPRLSSGATTRAAECMNILIVCPADIIEAIAIALIRSKKHGRITFPPPLPPAYYSPQAKAVRLNYTKKVLEGWIPNTGVILIELTATSNAFFGEIKKYADIEHLDTTHVARSRAKRRQCGL